MKDVQSLIKLVEERTKKVKELFACGFGDTKAARQEAQKLIGEAQNLEQKLWFSERTAARYK